MVELDIIKKHGKKALGLEHHYQPTWRQRIPEILLEIGIIVFAIMLSLQLEKWHETAADRETEHRFLVGLRTDLQSDLQELREDSLSYVKVVKGFRYFRKLGSQAPNADSLRRYQSVLYNTTNLIPNNSRFEGLRSSGKLGVIEDEELLNDILESYQELIPSLLSTSQYFTAYKEQKIQGYLDDNLHSSGDNFIAVVSSNRMQNYLSKGGIAQEIINRYHQVMQQNRKILRRIDKQLAE
jgi:hypothetical protein